jgi:hypothetical protein
MVFVGKTVCLPIIIFLVERGEASQIVNDISFVGLWTFFVKCTKSAQIIDSVPFQSSVVLVFLVETAKGSQFIGKVPFETEIVFFG